MVKPLSANPVTAHHKAEKQRQLKRAKQAQHAQRDAKLATRATGRLDRRIRELTDARAAHEAAALDPATTTSSSSGAAAASGFGPREREELAALERDLAAIRRAKRKLGVADEDEQRQQQQKQDRDGDQDRGAKRPRLDRARPDGPGHGYAGARGNANMVPVAGGRGGPRWGRRPGQEDGGDSSETDSDVGDIPMPTDVQNMPPPPRRGRRRDGEDGSGDTRSAVAPQRPAAPVQTVFESKPMVRNLQKEATLFVPAAVQAKLKSASADNSQPLPNSTKTTVEDD